jgi:hypothetical protein
MKEIAHTFTHKLGKVFTMIVAQPLEGTSHLIVDFEGVGDFQLAVVGRNRSEFGRHGTPYENEKKCDMVLTPQPKENGLFGYEALRPFSNSPRCLTSGR